MASGSIVEREVQLQAQLFTFLKGAHEDLEPYWYKTVEGGDIDVSSWPLLLGITDETWRNFAVAAGIARVKQGGLQFKANVFVQLLHDYNIDATTTFMRRNEWRPYNQLMVQIGGSRRCKNDTAPPSLRSHLQNPTKSPEFDHHPKVRRGRQRLMSNSTVKTAMETPSIAFGADKNEAGVDSSTSTTTEQVVTEMMGNLSIRTDRPELSIVTAQLTVVQTGTMVITPMNDEAATNTHFLPGCSIMECSRRLPHCLTVTTTEARPSSEQLWTSTTSSRSSALTTPLSSESSQQTSQSGSRLLARLVSPESQPRTQAGNDNKTFGSRQVTVGMKEKYNVKNVPNTHTLITKSQEAKYKHCAEQIAKLNDYLSKEKHTSNEESRILHAAAMAHVPALGPEKASHFIGLSNCAFLSAVGIEYDIEHVMKTSAGQGYLRKSVKRGAVSSLLLLVDELESVRSIYIAVDKAPGSEGGFVKYLTWCNHEKRTVKKFFLDAEGSGGFASEGAEAIANSLRKIPLNKRMLAGQASVKGGGLAIEPLAKELTALGLTTDNYLIANCTLHNAQLSLAQPYERVFGVGKTDVRNAIQLLFYARTLQEAYGAEAFPRIFEATVSKLGLDHRIHKYTVLSKPILSRWWWVGKCLKQVLKGWEVWRAINVAVTNIEPSRSKRNIAASNLHSLMQEGVLRADLEFTRAYLDRVLNHNFEWLQGRDTKLDGEPGFRCREILVRFFHISDCLEKLRKLYDDKNSDEFAGFRELVVRLPTEQKEAMDRKVHSFISSSIRQLDKNFDRWANGPLFFLASFSSFKTAQVVARILLSLPPLYEHTASSGDVVLLEHDAAINMFDFQEFVVKRSSGRLLGVQTSSNVMDNLPALQLIANGSDMWDEVAEIDVLVAFQKLFFVKFARLASVTQMVEGGVKKIGHYTTTGRLGKLGSCYGIAANSYEHITSSSQEEVDGKRRRVHAKRGCIQPIQIAHQAIKNGRIIDEMKRGENGHVIQNRQVELKEILDGQGESSLRKKRVDSTVEKFKEGFNITRPANSRMNMTGVTLTAAALGQVSYKDLRMKYHTTELRKELFFRGIGQEDLFNHRTGKAMGFTELKKQLQNNTGDTSSFNQLCVEADFTPHFELLLDAVNEN